MNNDNLQDYYEDLKISPNADSETIDRVFRLLAKRYHPDNQVTGNADAFNRISTAYKVLADIEKRASYDAQYEAVKAKKWKASEPASSTKSSQNDELLRKRILSILYIERRNDAASSGVGLWRIEQLIGLPEKILEFHVWYMKEKGWIQRTDTGGYAITVAGVDAVEEGEIILSEDRLLPDPDDFAYKTRKTTNSDNFNSRSQRLIPNPC
jgi:curved DNA-binding protein CbpA